MKYLIFFFMFPLMFVAQNNVSGLVLDVKTREPIEFVDVVADDMYTSTNADGRFQIKTLSGTLNFSLIGYEPYVKSINAMGNTIDTILLQSKFLQLDEVVIKNQQISLADFIRVGNNYPFEDYSEAFFLRAYLTKNDSILKLQDLSGLIKRKQLLATGTKPKPKKNVEVQVTNMRKVGKKENEVYFQMWGISELDDILTSIAMSSKYYNFEENISKDSSKIKLNFNANSNHVNPSSNGFYIINKENKAIEEFYLMENKIDVPFEIKNGVKYKTIDYEVNVYFKKDETKKLYFLDKAKVSATVELYDLDKPLTPFVYDANYIWYSLNRVNKKINKNVSSNKDVFKLDYPYDESFWSNQSLLTNTERIKKFIKGVNSKNNKDYISNFN